MIDTHAHLSEIKTEEIKGLKAVILAGASLKESEVNVRLAKVSRRLWAAAGIHPKTKLNQIDVSLDKLDKLIGKNKKWIKAIGECGLDFKAKAEVDKQERLFRGQICLSLKHKLPLIIHARAAVDEVLEIVRQYAKTGGVFHCYAGGKKRIKKILELTGKWYFGIDGNITYEQGMADVVKEIPKNRLVLETDSPFLTPLPYRGEKNKPVYIKHVYQKVAEIWQKGFTETEKMIDKNAHDLFEI